VADDAALDIGNDYQVWLVSGGFLQDLKQPPAVEEIAFVHSWQFAALLVDGNRQSVHRRMGPKPHERCYLMFKTMTDLAGTMTVSTPFFSLASL